MCSLDIVTPVSDMGSRVSKYLKEVEALPLMDWEAIFMKTVDMLPLFDKPTSDADVEKEDEPEVPEDREAGTPAKKQRTASPGSPAQDQPFDWSPKLTPPKKPRTVVKKSKEPLISAKTPDTARKEKSKDKEKEKRTSPKAKDTKEKRERARERDRDRDSEGSPRPVLTTSDLAQRLGRGLRKP